MKRRSINPVPWSVNLGFDQAQLVEGHQRVLVCSGQDAVDADGNSQYPGDMGAQLEMSLNNLEAVLAAGDMTLANVVRLNVYTTDFDELVNGHVSRTASGTPVVARPPCSVSRGCSHQTSWCCWRQPPLTDPQMGVDGGRFRKSKDGGGSDGGS